jgi:hypothetical protein
MLHQRIFLERDGNHSSSSNSSIIDDIGTSTITMIIITSVNITNITVHYIVWGKE